jgi:hexosaminidase
MKTRYNSIFALVVISLLTISSCKTEEKTKKTAISKDLLKENIIPKPVSLTATGSSFELNTKSEIHYQNDDLKPIAEYLSELLQPATGFKLPVKVMSSMPSTNHIYLSLSDSIQNKEGYQLTIKENGIDLKAKKTAGLFYGIQTLRQLLPANIELKEPQKNTWLIASGTIIDEPSYSYRGAMLDVARHFIGVNDVKRYIDLLSFYKINTLHIHLSDDQGWRIEIKSWPNLTTHGGSTEVGGGESGFFTQEQYKELVKYAQDRFITIVPEIDMPGHTNAALSSYPELNCNGKATKPYTGTRVGFSSFCTDKEITYKFIDDVIRELAAMTPGEYIHIGGDESDATPIKEYIKFINKVQKIVTSHGKKVLGWDEIAHATLEPNTIVQYWARDSTENKNAFSAVKQNAKILMSPATKAYLDMKYDKTTKIGLDWAGTIEVDAAYNWSLENHIEGISKENIIGVEAPLWTETVENLKDLEYLAFPRVIGLAEIGWTPTSQRNWEEYKVRLGKHKDRLDALNINYYDSKLVPWQSVATDTIIKVTK